MYSLVSHCEREMPRLRPLATQSTHSALPRDQCIVGSLADRVCATLHSIAKFLDWVREHGKAAREWLIPYSI